MAPHHGWDDSAEAWIRFVDEGDLNRTLLLDPLMLEHLGDVAGRDVLDVGCGEGRFCRMLAERGARCVGVDPVAALIDAARARGGGPEFHLGRAERLAFADESFDAVASYVALCDVPGYREAIAEMARVLRPGGRIVASNVSTVFTALNRGWLRDELGTRLHVPVDDYLREGGAEVAWRGIQVVNWHRPLEAYFQAFLGVGLILRAFRQPAPSQAIARAHPSLADHRRVPNFHLMVWERP